MSKTPPPEKQALFRAAAVLQGQAALAAALGYSDRRCVWPYFSTARQFPPEQCPAVERATAQRGEVVTCEELRPDVAWLRMADAQWPWHPQGRPLIDVTAAVITHREQEQGAQGQQSPAAGTSLGEAAASHQPMPGDLQHAQPRAA